MALRLHNTLTGRVEEFVPLEPGRVRMYVCGVTVYDRSHIGHARALVTFDVLYRFLRDRGYEVTFVRNFTDIDDKILARAQTLGIPPEKLAAENIRAFEQDVRALGCLPPTLEPRATEHVPEMIELIRELERKGLAYPVDGDVYFSVRDFPGYGKLSKRRLDDMVAGARVQVDPRKRHPMDFALWKASKPGEPAWPSPWGPGRPGWHIECSAMGAKYLGQPFDIHGGGSDLVFPHHENEIAQSEGAKGVPLARYWVHNGLVSVAHEKMSKSAGNFMTVEEAARRYGGEALRLFCLGTHYRNPLDFSPDRLAENAKSLHRVYETLARATEAAGSSVERARPEVPPAFSEALEDDLNTAKALGVFFETLRATNRSLDAGESRERVAHLLASLRAMGRVLGIAQQDPHAFLEEERRRTLRASELDAEEIEKLVAERAAARKARDFRRADAIRDELKARGIVLEDTPEGTKWRVEGPKNAPVAQQD
ncbi:MAG: cysteine--tRNA ligase [Candidatus Binatia bacterium]|nr:MAG: cysteine--tRNA ligase [Candidatus Binatia bacterium]